MKVNITWGNERDPHSWSVGVTWRWFLPQRGLRGWMRLERQVCPQFLLNWDREQGAWGQRAIGNRPGHMDKWMCVCVAGGEGSGVNVNITICWIKHCLEQSFKSSLLLSIPLSKWTFVDPVTSWLTADSALYGWCCCVEQNANQLMLLCWTEC
jgi:hypothetical protein